MDLRGKIQFPEVLHQGNLSCITTDRKLCLNYIKILVLFMDAKYCYLELLAEHSDQF